MDETTRRSERARVDDRIASVIIPCLNAGATLGAALDALAAQRIRGRLHVVVVDNGSSDESIEIASEGADQVAVVTEPGAHRARNVGLSFVSTRFVLTLDADCEPIDNDWAAEHIAALERARTDVFGSVGKVVPAPSSDWWANRPEITPQPLLEGGQPLHAVGANACYLTERVRRLGGFPPFRADDVALGRLARAHGFTYVFTPGAVVYHRNAEGWRGYYEQMQKIGAYTAEQSGAPVSFTGFAAATARRMAANVRPLLRGDAREALAGCLRVGGQTKGALAVWRDVGRDASHEKTG
jgi:glycosyltransferase involved in cell wall biosynthesis